jgi:deoxyribodipyrimidine photo-lyase
VRRELAMNFVWYTDDYDDYEAVVPRWARKSLALHSDDERSFEYDYEQFAAAKTHDPYWNAAQNELLQTGSMHNYMRMYWGKKIIEWSATPQQAYSTMLRLNNTYQLDGRDANSFAGVAWCFGTHDRAWAERAIFGKVRYMNAQGLERKFAIKKYVERWGG